MNLFRFGLLFLVAMLSAACTHVTQTPKTANTPPVLSVDGYEAFIVKSAQVGQDYRIRVRTPASYATNPNKRYPVVIKIDGQWDFGLLTGAYNCLYFDGQMPETIFIGIDWNVADSMVHPLRARDLSPVALPQIPNSGQAKAFVQAIAEEILPAVNNRYRTTGKEFLVGGSWGGLLVTYALMERPDVFDGALAIGSSYNGAERSLQAQLNALAKAQPLNGKRFYLGMGKLDPAAPGGVEYYEALKKADIKGLQHRVDFLEGFGHSGTNIPGYAAGLQFLFARPSLNLPPQSLQKFAGFYAPVTGQGEGFKLQVGENNLQVVLGNEVINLVAEAENQFYRQGVFFNLTFDGDWVTAETFFGTNRYKRTRP
ncbi:MAG TPA: alpha/beta hydrolase-fold protein [Cellvibrionaceae bacterium]|nr:alpha/beta hydrolase-fold protein [Cellvibrionaceae bacterium]